MQNTSSDLRPLPLWAVDDHHPAQSGARRGARLGREGGVRVWISVHHTRGWAGGRRTQLLAHKLSWRDVIYGKGVI